MVNRIRKYYDPETPMEQRKNSAAQMFRKRRESERGAWHRSVYKPQITLGSFKSKQRVQESTGADDEDLPFTPHRLRRRNDQRLSSNKPRIELGSSPGVDYSPFKQEFLESTLTNSMNRPFGRQRSQRDRHLPFEDDPGRHDRSLPNPESLPESRPVRESTLSDPERRVFSRLFDSLTTLPDGKGPREKKSSRAGDSEDGTSDSAPDKRASRFEEAVEEDEDDLIELGEHYYPDLGRDEAPSTQSEDPDFLGRYPTELRYMAAEAKLKQERERQQQRLATQKRLAAEGTKYDPEIAQQRREMRRIEHELYGAETDVGLWQILEKDLFSKLDVLDQKQRMQNDPAQRQNAKRPEPQKPEEKQVKIAGKDYQNLFWLATRLFCRRVSYTPFAEHLLARIKSHSLTSYALGSSTRLYNEIMAHHWRFHTDLGALVSYLREMHSAGLPMSTKTLAIVDEATSFRSRALRGDFGVALQAVEGMVARSRDADDLKKWQKRMRRSIEESVVERARRLEIERKMRAEGAFAYSETDDHQSPSVAVAA